MKINFDSQTFGYPDDLFFFKTAVQKGDVMKKVMLWMAGCLAMSVFAQGSGITAKQTEVMQQLLVTYEAQAKEEAKVKGSPSGPYRAFTAAAGREFYLKRRSWQKTDPTCSNCHTEDPKQTGKHSESKKSLNPLAPAANPERFTDIAKVERNFAEHCQDMLGRDCYGNEKGSYIAYMMSVK